MFSLRNLFRTKTLLISIAKEQKELLELLLTNKSDFEEWLSKQASSKIKFQFYYPTAIDFYYDEFKLFNAYFKKGIKGNPEFQEMKMTETNYDSIRTLNWGPFEEVIIEFLTTLEESKKIALFEKRKTLFEYQSLCSREAALKKQGNGYPQDLSTSPLQIPVG